MSTRSIQGRSHHSILVVLLQKFFVFFNYKDVYVFDYHSVKLSIYPRKKISVKTPNHWGFIMISNQIISGYSHSFDVGVARKLGTNAAIVLNHIMYWLRINKIKNENQKDGRTWMFETTKDMADFLGYMSEKQVRLAIDILVKNNLLVKGHFHKNHFNRTNWYALYDEEVIGDKIDLPSRANVLDTQEKSELPSRADVYINNNNNNNNSVVVVKAENPPLDCGNVHNFSKDDLYFNAVRLKKDWSTSEIEEAWRRYSSMKFKDGVSSPLDYIEGIIKNLRQKESVICKNQTNLKKEKWNSMTKESKKESEKKKSESTKTESLDQDTKTHRSARLIYRNGRAEVLLDS